MHRGKIIKMVTVLILTDLRDGVSVFGSKVSLGLMTFG